MIDITSASAVSVSGKHALQLLEHARAVQSDGKRTYTANGSLQVSSANDTGALIASIIKLIMDAKGNTLLTIAATGGDSTASAQTGDGNDTIRVDTGSVLVLNGGDGNDHINLSAKGTIHAVSGGKGDDTVIIDNQGQWASNYYYAIGDGQDTLSTNAAIEIHAFSETGTARYNIADAWLERDGNVVTLSFGNDSDSLRIEFTGAMAQAEEYAFTYNPAIGSLMIHDAATPASQLTTFVQSFKRPQSA